jgi:hypothetical protein
MASYLAFGGFATFACVHVLAFASEMIDGL